MPAYSGRKEQDIPSIIMKLRVTVVRCKVSQKKDPLLCVRVSSKRGSAAHVASTPQPLETKAGFGLCIGLYAWIGVSMDWYWQSFIFLI